MSLEGFEQGSEGFEQGFEGFEQGFEGFEVRTGFCKLPGFEQGTEGRVHGRMAPPPRYTDSRLFLQLALTFDFLPFFKLGNKTYILN